MELISVILEKDLQVHHSIIAAGKPLHLNGLHGFGEYFLNQREVINQFIFHKKSSFIFYKIICCMVWKDHTY
uniref:Putative ovule protein n=1 Tax=Solanum chacoense TaxID=4108 RepID=A0A0V0HBF6_SOLCH